MRRSPELPMKPRWKIKRTGVQAGEGHAVAKEVQSNMVEIPPIASPGNLDIPLQPLFPGAIKKLL